MASNERLELFARLRGISADAWDVEPIKNDESPGYPACRLSATSKNGRHVVFVQKAVETDVGRQYWKYYVHIDQTLVWADASWTDGNTAMRTFFEEIRAKTEPFSEARKKAKARELMDF